MEQHFLWLRFLHLVMYAFTPICTRNWYDDWSCVECCKGDRCNKYVIVSWMDKIGNEILYKLCAFQLGSSSISSSVFVVLSLLLLNTFINMVQKLVQFLRDMTTSMRYNSYLISSHYIPNDFSFCSFLFIFNEFLFFYFKIDFLLFNNVNLNQIQLVGNRKI